MSQEIDWKFPHANDGALDGFNDSSIDMFRSERIQALARETIQNSLDAAADGGGPVVVRFSLHEFPDSREVGYNTLAAYLEAAEQIEPSESGKAFYENALARVRDGRVRLLGVHDYGTNGLTGPSVNPPEDPKAGPWLALVKGAGITFKASNAALGSFGHGSKAPFAMSEIRAIYYFTRIAEGESTEMRFQGKSILQSVPLASITDDNEWSVGTGYFGMTARCAPLIASAVPRWAIDARPEPGEASLGTSVYIAEPYSADDEATLWSQIELAVVANFYYAIRTGKLVVHIGDGIALNEATIDDAFDTVTDVQTLDALEPTDKVRDRLEAARTVRHAELRGTLNLPGFGEIAWFMRVQDLSSRRVGVARGNGMLITRTPERLQRFNGVKPFDLFVCVSGDDGSALLRRLENPEHTEFSFDRISDVGERRAAARSYRSFADAIRELIKEHAAIEVTEEIEIDDLDDFFRGGDGSGGADDRAEPRSALRIESSRPISRTRARPTVEPGGDTEGDGAGRRGGPRKRRSSGGDIPGVGSGRSKRAARSGVPVKDLRVVRHSAASNTATVSFTPLGPGGSSLVLMRSGESDTSRLRVRKVVAHGDERPFDSSLSLENLAEGARKRVEIEFEPGELDYAIEGRLEK